MISQSQIIAQAAEKQPKLRNEHLTLTDRFPSLHHLQGLTLINMSHNPVLRACAAILLLVVLCPLLHAYSVLTHEEIIAKFDRDNGIKYGLQSMCEGGGMANATILELL